MARLSFRCDEDLVRRVDAERCLVPREAWLRWAVERALGEAKEPPTKEHADPGSVPREPVGSPRGVRSAAPAEQPAPDWDDDEAHRAVNVEWQRQAAMRNSAQAKRDVRPVPKGGR